MFNRGNSKDIALRELIRDSDGSYVVSFMYNIGSQHAVSVGIRNVLKGYKLVHDIGIKKLVIEVDSFHFSQLIIIATAHP